MLRHQTRIPTLVLVLGAVLWPVAAAAQADTVVIRNVTVLPMDRDTALLGRTVVVSGDRITELGAASDVSVPHGARVMDGTSRYLLPGLVDAHVHLRDTTELARYLAHGVTTVFQLSGPQENVSGLRGLREAIRAGDVPGPRLVLSGRLIDGDPPVFGSFADVVTTPAEARALVRARKEAGYDVVKVYNNVPRDVLPALVDEAHRLGLAVFGHVPRAESRAGALEAALEAGLDVITHGEELFFTRFYGGIDDALDAGRRPRVDTTGLGDVIAGIRRAGTAVTPNLSFVRQTRLWLDDAEAVRDHPEYGYLSPERRRSWERNNPLNREDVERFDMRERAKAQFLDLLTLKLHDAGVPLLAGTDASFAGLYPGASLHLELRELVRVGLSPYQALRTATVEPGRILERIDPAGGPYGVVREGARADLLLLEADPREGLEALDRIVGLAVAGRWVGADPGPPLPPGTEPGGP